MTAFFVKRFLLGQEQKTADEWQNPITLAQQFVDLLAQAQSDSAVGYFDANMTKALPAKKLQGVWQSLQGQMGAFKAPGSVRTEMIQIYHVLRNL